MVSEAEVNRIATILFDTWKRVDPNSGVAKYPVSYVATFADMARAIVADRGDIETAIRADQVERDAKVAESWKLRWAEDHKRFDDQFWEAGAAVAEQIENDIRQKGSDHAG